MNRLNLKTAGIFAALLLLIIPSLLPLFNSGFFVSDDGSWIIIRLTAFYDTIRDGQIPARFIERLNFGYGYPVANFLYPGYLYLGSIIHIVGFGFIDTVKILFGMSLVFSGIFSFIWLRRLFGNTDSLLGALVYVYSPYHIYDIYKRGSLGEALSIAVLPFVFYGIEKGSTLIIAFSVFSILLFHNTLAIFFLPLIPIYALLRKTFIRSLPGIILGGLMSSFFTIPALVELRYTKFSQTPISNPLEYFADLSLIGYSTVFIFVGVVLLSFIIYKNNFKKIPYLSLLVFFSAVLLISLVLASHLSIFIWNIINSSYIQFPYRFLSLLLISVSFTAAYLSYILFSKAKITIFAFTILITGFFSYQYLSNIKYLDFPDEYYSTNEATTTVHNEYMPIWVRANPIERPKERVEVLSGDVSISNFQEKSNRIEFDTIVSSDSRIRINTIYWPGWKLFVEGEERDIFYDNERGVMEFEMKQYDERVYISLQDDLVRTISNTISLVAALILVYYIARPVIKI